MPRRVEDQIAALEARMAQEQARLRDLKAQATKQERRDDARRKLLYGAAWLAALDALSEDARRRSLDRVEKHISRAKDRAFLGLEPLEEPDEAPEALTGDRPVTRDLPFGDADSDGRG
jgi:hypothetical protein